MQFNEVLINNNGKKIGTQFISVTLTLGKEMHFEEIEIPE